MPEESSSIDHKQRRIHPIWRCALALISAGILAMWLVTYKVAAAINMSYFRSYGVPLTVVDVLVGLSGIYLLLVAIFGRWKPRRRSKRILLLLALSIPGLAIAQQAENRILGLTTQDLNGLHIVFIVATPSVVRASVREFSPGHDGEERASDYPRDLFDELWRDADTLGLPAFAAGDVKDLGASKHYVLAIQSGGASGPTMYLIPKCSAPRAIESFVKRLSHDLLPAGSPGLFEPCPERVRRGEGRPGSSFKR